MDAHKGSLFMITPEEQALAILLKVADDVRHGAKDHKQLRLVLLSVPVFTYVITKEEQVQSAAHNARQIILQYYWTMARTAQQQCYEVVVVKNTLQRTLGRVPTKKEMSDMFHRNIKLADGRQEGCSENCVKDS